MAQRNIERLYENLLNHFGPQGWWPIVNDRTLMCEYHTGAPRNEEERFEIAVGAILAQNTQWYPNVVRAIQQLKIGRPFTKEESNLIQQAEWLYHKEFGNMGCKIDIPKNTKINKNRKDVGKKDNILPYAISRKNQIITKDDILAQNTSWKNVEKAILNLIDKDILDKDKILNLTSRKLALLIKSSGYHNQKAKKLKEFVKFLDSGKEITRKNLLDVWGIGPETADSILLYAYKKPIFVIDAYTKRIMNRIGFREKNYDELQLLFMNSLPNDFKLFNEFHALLVEHGKNICKKEPLCENCSINLMCHYYKKKHHKK